MSHTRHGPLARYATLQVAHVPGMPGTFSPPPRVSDTDMNHGTCVTHVPWCMSGSLTRGFLQRRRRGKHSRQSLRMRKPQFYVSGKKPMAELFGTVSTLFKRPTVNACCSTRTTWKKMAMSDSYWSRVFAGHLWWLRTKECLLFIVWQAQHALFSFYITIWWIAMIPKWRLVGW